jgi:O-antigen/teichoic acid export membrane protein
VNEAQPGRSLARDSIRTLVFNAAATLVTVVTGIVVAKALGPIGKGEFSGLALLQNAAGSATGGIGAAATYQLTKQKRQLADIAPALLALLAALSLVIPACLLLWGLRFGFDLAIVVFAATVPAALVVSWQQGLLLGLNKVRSLNAQIVGYAFFQLIVVSVALLMHRGIPGAMWAWSICTYGAAVAVIGRALSAGTGQRTLGFREALTSIWQYGTRASLFGILGFLNYRIDSLVLIAFLGAPGFGVYSVAVAAGEILFRVPRAVATATTFRVGSGDFAQSAETTAKSIRTSTAVFCACAVALFAVAPWLIELLYGSRFAGAAPALRILLPGIVMFAPAGLFSPFFALQMGRPMFVVYINLIMIAIQTGTGVWLVPRIGLNGAAIASTATYVTSALFVTWYFCRLTTLRWTDVWILRREDLTSLRRLVRPGAPSRRASSAR